MSSYVYKCFCGDDMWEVKRYDINDKLYTMFEKKSNLATTISKYSNVYNTRVYLRNYFS